MSNQITPSSSDVTGWTLSLSNTNHYIDSLFLLFLRVKKVLSTHHYAALSWFAPLRSQQGYQTPQWWCTGRSRPPSLQTLWAWGNSGRWWSEKHSRPFEFGEALRPLTIWKEQQTLKVWRSSQTSDDLKSTTDPKGLEKSSDQWRSEKYNRP